MQNLLLMLFIFLLGGLCGGGLASYLNNRIHISVVTTKEVPPLSTEACSKKEEPLLASPIFRRSGVLHSAEAGHIFVHWHQVAGAKEYQLTVYKEVDGGEGEVLQKFRIPRVSTSIKNLAMDPGQSQTYYRLRVHAVDEDGNIGRSSESKRLAVIMRTEKPQPVETPVPVQTRVETQVPTRMPAQIETQMGTPAPAPIPVQVPVQVPTRMPAQTETHTDRQTTLPPPGIKRIVTE